MILANSEINTGTCDFEKLGLASRMVCQSIYISCDDSFLCGLVASLLFETFFVQVTAGGQYSILWVEAVCDEREVWLLPRLILPC